MGLHGVLGRLAAVGYGRVDTEWGWMDCEFGDELLSSRSQIAMDSEQGDPMRRPAMEYLKLTTTAWLACLMLASACVSVDPEHDWREEPHHFSMLFSGTIEEEESAPSIGLDYEYRASRFLGLGAVVEEAFEDIDATTVIGVADLHLTNQFIVQTGPGVEFVDDEEEFVYRLGVLYEFERDGYTLSPQIHHDWTSGEDAFVVGIALGFCF